jgi:hypothetical protein
MAKLNRWDVLTQVNEVGPATREAITDAFGADTDRKLLDNAFEAAQRHGLIQADGDEGGASKWVLSEKGQRKLAARS